MKSYHDSKKGVGIIFDDIYLSGGARTPFGKFCGTLGKVSPTDLGIYSCKGALDKTGTSPSDIHQVVVANIGQASTDAYFLPRHIALYSGVPLEVPTLMVQRICASGFETIVTASEQITLGKADTVLCCGTESMTLAPTVSFGNRMGYALGKIEFKDMLWEALDDTAAGYPMGITAENLAQKHGITRDDVDEFARLSSDRVIKARETGFFDDEILQMNSTKFEIEGLKTRTVRLPKGVENFNVDENVRATSLESLKKLPSAFTKDGVQTAGNSSGIVDGSASVVVSSSDKGKVKPLAKIIAASSCGVEPKHMGIGPVPAINLLLELTGLKIDDIGLFEINEAFAAQYIACEKELKIDRSRANVNGGSIAIGHPLAASGVRLALTISREMIRRKVKYGIVSACIGGGQGTAILLENCNL